LRRPIEITALSLTTPTFSRDFIRIFCAHDHTFPVAREARLGGSVVSPASPLTSSGRFRFIASVLPTKHLFGHHRP